MDGRDIRSNDFSTGECVGEITVKKVSYGAEDWVYWATYIAQIPGRFREC